MRTSDMTRVRVFRAVGTLAALLVVASPVHAAAQQPAKAAAAKDSAAAKSAASSASADSVLQYRREVFQYPSGIKNPFTPVTAGEKLGPRFEDLELSGIIYNEQLGSVAVLVDRTTGKRYRVHEGERVGQARVARIRPDEVSFVVSGFGQSRAEVLRVKKQQKETSG
jgi:hypothetical protein